LANEKRGGRRAKDELVADKRETTWVLFIQNCLGTVTKEQQQDIGAGNPHGTYLLNFLFLLLLTRNSCKCMNAHQLQGHIIKKPSEVWGRLN
jgi:hypothetical protein